MRLRFRWMPSFYGPATWHGISTGLLNTETLWMMAMAIHLRMQTRPGLVDSAYRKEVKNSRPRGYKEL